MTLRDITIVKGLSFKSSGNRNIIFKAFDDYDDRKKVMEIEIKRYKKEKHFRVEYAFSRNIDTKSYELLFYTGEIRGRGGDEFLTKV